MLLQGRSVFSSLVPPAEGPRRGRQRFTRGRAAAVGTPALVAWTLPLGATRWPELHSASLRDPGNSLFVRPPSGIPEGKQHLHLSVSTCPFIYVQATGRGAGSHNPGSGPPRPLPSPAPQGNRCRGNSMRLLLSFIHSTDTAPPSKEPPGMWGDRVRSAGVPTGPARPPSPAQEEATVPGSLDGRPGCPQGGGRAELTGTAPASGVSHGAERQQSQQMAGCSGNS